MNSLIKIILVAVMGIVISIVCSLVFDVLFIISDKKYYNEVILYDNNSFYSPSGFKFGKPANSLYREPTDNNLPDNILQNSLPQFVFRSVNMHPQNIKQFIEPIWDMPEDMNRYSDLIKTEHSQRISTVPSFGLYAFSNNSGNSDMTYSASANISVYGLAARMGGGAFANPQAPPAGSGISPGNDGISSDPIQLPVSSGIVYMMVLAIVFAYYRRKNW